MKQKTLHVMQIFLLVTATGLVWLTLAVSSDVTLIQLLPPMFLLGCGFGVITSQIPNIQLSSLAPGLQGEGSGFAETGKELGIGLGTAVIASIMFSMAIGGFVDNVARAGDFPLTLDERSAVILEIEDEAYPDEALQVVAQRVPNLDQLGKEAYVEAFQATLSLLVGIVLVALLLASLIPKVEVEAVTDPDTREAVADVSSKRL